MRRIGVLMTVAADDPESQRRMAAFVQGLQELGWTDGRNVRIDTRWGAGDADRDSQIRGGIGRARAGRHPGPGGTVVGALLQATRTVPIVFTLAVDPVGAGFVDEPGAAGRQRHRFHPVRIRHQREMAGAAQRDRTARDASGGPSRSRPYLRGSASSP